MADRSQGETALVQFNERLTNSAAFGNLIREGMDLVEEAAAYLDGDGRTDARAVEQKPPRLPAGEQTKTPLTSRCVLSFRASHGGSRPSVLLEKARKLLLEPRDAAAAVEHLLAAAGPGRVGFGVDVEVQLVAFL